jgi:hypothetical protein
MAWARAHALKAAPHSQPKHETTNETCCGNEEVVLKKGHDDNALGIKIRYMLVFVFKMRNAILQDAVGDPNAVKS